MFAQGDLDKPKEACGLFGFYNQDSFNTAEMLYYGIFALQHRGQESCGMAVNDNGHIIYHKEMGLVTEVFNNVTLAHLKGKFGIAHTRYCVSAEHLRENAEPFVLKYKKGQMAFAHNGAIVNADELRENLEEIGFFFQTNTDGEVVAALLALERIRTHSMEDAMVSVMKMLKGAYCCLVLTPTKLVAARDPLGIRPLVIGKRGNSYMVCSETAALTAVGAEFIRDVLPGEVVIIDQNGLRTIQTLAQVPDKKKTALCIFEHVYFARPDSVIDGANVYQSRFEAGRKLAQEYKIDADAVIGVPDSGVASALGYAFESGLPYIEGMIKNRYIGRTFIQPSQAMREQSVAMKLIPIATRIAGKRLIMIDDSIVRGTTSKIIVQMLKKAGATQVHMLVSSPPVKYPCYFGIDTSDKGTLIANTTNIEGIRQTIGADSLGFISLEGLLQTPVGAKCSFCKACFDGNYPIEI